MQDTPKLMLTIVAGGVLIGAWLGQFASPVMQFAPQPEWRTRLSERLQPDFSASPLQFVDAGPQDLSPFGLTPGMMTARHVEMAEPALPEAIDQALDDASAAAEALDDPVPRLAPPPITPASFASLPATVSDPPVETDNAIQ